MIVAVLCKSCKVIQHLDCFKCDRCCEHFILHMLAQHTNWKYCPVCSEAFGDTPQQACERIGVDIKTGKVTPAPANGEPECTCYETDNGHQQGCPMKPLPAPAKAAREGEAQA